MSNELLLGELNIDVYCFSCMVVGVAVVSNWGWLSSVWIVGWVEVMRIVSHLSGVVVIRILYISS